MTKMTDWKITRSFNELIRQDVWYLEWEHGVLDLVPVSYEDSYFLAIEVACIFMDDFTEWQNVMETYGEEIAYALYFSPFVIRDEAWKKAGLPVVKAA